MNTATQSAPGRARAEGEMTLRPQIKSRYWTVKEENSLRVMAESGAETVAIAKRLSRTELSIRQRIDKLGLRTKAPGQWSMKTDRELIKLARANCSGEQIAGKLDAPLQVVLKVAKRLGVNLAAKKARPRS